MKFSALVSERVFNMKAPFFALILFVFVINPVMAQQANQPNIVVVDVDKIVNVSSAGKSIQNQLKVKREAFQKEFSAREDNLLQAQKTLIEQKETMSPEDFMAKRKDFEKQLLDTRSLFQKRRNSLDKGLGNALSELRKNIIQVTAEVADENNYEIVVTRDSVVIVQKELDITETVLNSLNAKISNISLGTE